MITGGEIYQILAAMLPMYVAMLLGYAAVKWWRIFTPEQCAGINRFVANFGLPILVFRFMTRNNPYDMNFHFIAADALQKVVILAALLAWLWLCKSATIDWAITLYSLSTIPNTIVIGVPLLKAMYGHSAITLLIQIAVFQCLLWINLLMVMYEYRAATILLSDNSPHAADQRKSFRVDSNVVPLDAEADSPNVNDVVLRRSVSSRSDNKSSHHKDSQEPDDTCNASSSDDACGGVGVGSLSIDIEEETTTAVSINAADDLEQVRHGLEMVATVRGSATTPPTSNRTEGIIRVGPKKRTPSSRLMAKLLLILKMVWKNLLRSPMLYGSIVGLIWSLIAFRWNFSMPKIVEGSIDMLADTAIGMAMFGLGLSVALQPRIITCSKMETLIAMIVRFLVGPILTVVTSLVVGLRGPSLRVSIIQAVLPQGVITFVYSEVYKNHSDVLGTAVIFGTIISFPIVIIYYVIVGL